MTCCVGVLELTSKYRYGFTLRGTPLYLFRPYDDALPEFVVGCSNRDLSSNQIALVEYTDIVVGIVKARANLIRLIGPVGDFESERKALLLHYAPSKRVSDVDPIDDSLDAQRMEINSETGWFTYHIDPFGCKDIDDAIAFNRETGEVAITIADAAATVQEGSVVDTIAHMVGATFYNLEGVVEVPMLPRAISEGAASLTPGQRRRGVTLIVDREGRETFVLSWITVQHSYTYESADESREIMKDEEHADSHKTIETLMIRYNTATARLLKKYGFGILRAQADAAKVSEWASVDPSLQGLANEAASYVPASTQEDTVHASLDLEVYCHATSPIRRYADLVNQRYLKSIITGSDISATSMEEMATHLNERTKANRRWTRDLTFLTHVTPGRVHYIDVMWISADQFWVPEWKRIVRAKHLRPVTVGTDGVSTPVVRDRVAIFCDPTKRNWKNRVLTAAS
jgi:exoribonuclease R